MVELSPCAPEDANPLRFLLNHLRTALLRLDAQGTVRYANPAAEALLGLSASKLLGHPVAMSLQADAPLARLVQQALATHRSLICRALPLRPRASSAFDSMIDVQLSPLEEDRQFAGVLLECHDAQARLRFDRDAANLVQLDANRTMVRQLAHEIKNPLGGLRGAAQLLERRLGEDGREYTGIIMREADRLTQLVDSLLGPPRRSRPAWVNVHEPLDDLVRLVRADELTRVQIVTDYDPSLPNVLIDRDEVIQAIHNLVRNALQAMNEAGRLRVRTRAVSQAVVYGEYRSNMVRVDIEDDGPGVPESLRESLFFPLVTGRRDGTGIGLPTALELISRQRGSIEYESKPGRTVFSVLLPAEDPTPHE
ncbi:MAG: nitrogen regulation protein NR(II) [Pseudomonadota bacterium]